MAQRRLSRELFAAHEDRAAKIRKAMVTNLKRQKVKDVAVLLSAGVDSHACLFAAMEAGLVPHCYSFTLADRESTDFKLARHTAQVFNLPFTPIILPLDIDSLKRYMLDLNYKYARDIVVNKSSVECLWPLFTSLSLTSKHEATIIGFGGDVFFATIRSMKKRLADYDVFKDDYLTNALLRQDPQAHAIDTWLSVNAPKHRMLEPINDKAVFNAMRGMHPFTEGSKPIQKAPIRLAFWDKFEMSEVRVHQSFQKGDSGISDHFQILLTSDWNIRKSKAVKGIYNDLQNDEFSYVPEKTLFSH